MPFPSTSLYPSTTLYPGEPVSATATVKYVYTVSNVTTADPAVSVTDTPAPGDVLVLLLATNSSNVMATAVSGCGATWSRVAGAFSANEILDVWIGTGATASGTVTVTAIPRSTGRAAAVYMVAGVTPTAVGVTATGTGARTTPSQTAGAGQVVLGISYSTTAESTVTATTPASGWVERAMTAGTSFIGLVSRAPATTEAHDFTAQRPTGTTYVSQVMVGDIVAASSISAAFTGAGVLTTALTNYRNLDSALSGSGALATALANYKRLNSAFSGTGALSTTWTDYRNLYSNFAGAGILTTALLTTDALIDSSFSGEGVLTTALTDYKRLSAAFSGQGALSTSLTDYKRITSAFMGSGALTTVNDGVPPSSAYIQSSFYGYGYLQTALEYSPRFSTDYTSEGVLFTELGYVVVPPSLGTAPLGKLASFSVNTAAVPVNPAEGSGSAPSVSAGYINGLDPEFALGMTTVLKNGAIGTYEGEVVRVGVSQGSAMSRISMDTVLTPLNTDLQLFPFIDGVPGLWTAARAVEYWTQQSGVFYDKVPGQCIAYASGFGHTNSYGASTTGRFYERLTGGATATQVVNGRSVKTLGAAVTGKTALHEVKDGTVPTTLPKNRKLVFSIGLGLLGTGRTTTVEWSFLDSKDEAHTVSLQATSAGAVTASVGGTVVATTSVPAGANYRLTFSLERLSATALVGKLTVHSDDLAGNGALIHEGKSTVVIKALPGILRLTHFEHRSAGGSGAEMIRWGTYLTVTEGHPLTLPTVQKVLAETKKPFGFVSGFTGNVWALLNEFCSISRLEVRFIDGALHLAPRSHTLSQPGVSWSQFEVERERREKYKQVALVNKQSKAVSTNDAVLWRADSVYQVAAREVFETTVQTGHSILSLVQPVAVSGITPFPYKQGGGQYVVTGADGYIIAPAWWNDMGGKIEVSLTGEEGEIAIKITAPTLDTVRAPYRISEGEADRPALYVCGSGIINDPKEVHVNTGAKNAREGFDNVFESPFVAGIMETYDTAAAMAHEYSASVADVQYALPNDFETPTGLGQFPAGTLVTDNVRNYRIMDASQTHSKVSGNAVPHTTIGAYVASYPAGATIKDEKARHFGRSIRKFNIKPLKGES